MAENSPPLKEQAHALIDNLLETATLDDVAYQAELRPSIEHGRADAQAGRLVAVEDLMGELGIEVVRRLRRTNRHVAFFARGD